MTGGGRQHYRLTICIELVELTNSVSDDKIQITILIRVSHITPFFELSLVLLTTHAIGLYEVTKKIQLYRQ